MKAYGHQDVEKKFTSESFQINSFLMYCILVTQAAAEEQQRRGAGGPAQEKGRRRNGVGGQSDRQGEPRDRSVACC